MSNSESSKTTSSNAAIGNLVSSYSAAECQIEIILRLDISERRKVPFDELSMIRRVSTREASSRVVRPRRKATSLRQKRKRCTDDAHLAMIPAYRMRVETAER